MNELFKNYTNEMLSKDSRRNLKNRVDRSIAAVTHAYEQYRKEVPQHVPSILISAPLMASLIISAQHFA